MSNGDIPLSGPEVPDATPPRRAAAPAPPTSVVLPTNVAPLDVDGTTAVAVGTALWAVAGLVLLVFFRGRLADAGNEWWLWACLAGVGLGLLGYAYCRRRSGRTPS